VTQPDRLRTYEPSECAVFRKTTEQWGGLSNMAAGYPVVVNGVHISTVEALYQACRFPLRPTLQKRIISERSPMTAKMITKPHRTDTRPDWDDVRVQIMRWCLRVKLVQNFDRFSALLLSTGDRPIVESSRKDDFWGAKTAADGTLIGQNVLGRSLRDLRDRLRTGELHRGTVVEPLTLPHFELFGRSIETVVDRGGVSSAPVRTAGPSWAVTQRALPIEPHAAVHAARESRPEPKERRMTVTRKKLIEVALPLGRVLGPEERKKMTPEAIRLVGGINDAASREKSIRHGHPSTLHLWWARRPLAAARAVIFAQMVDDPSSHPERFPTEEKQEAERLRLFRIIENLVQWESTTDERVLQAARDEIWKSWRDTCEDNKDDLRAAELFNPEKLPAFHDPFAGGGALPLEAQRLGMEAHASDLNPVAVLINKAMIEIPPEFANGPPVNPMSRKGSGSTNAAWKGAAGLAADVRYYGEWMRDEAESRIGHLYPKVNVTPEMTAERPDLKAYEGRELTVMASLWARTVKSPDPAYATVDVPLASTFMLSSKKGGESYVEPVIGRDGFRFAVRVGRPGDVQTKLGTTLGKRGGFRCLLSGVPISYDHIRTEGPAGRLGARLMALVAEGDRGRVYLSPTVEAERIALSAVPSWKPETPLNGKCRVNVSNYGLDTYGDLFTDRQLVALTTFSDLIASVRKRVMEEGSALINSPSNVDEVQNLSRYADAICVYLAFAISKLADRGSTICTWFTERDSTRNTFARQSIPMTWDYAEPNTLLDGSGSFLGAVRWTAESIEGVAAGYGSGVGHALVEDATQQSTSAGKVVSTDPPYYDNIAYADLSDFFYVWLRRSLQPSFPDLFATMAVPKTAELVASPSRHGGKDQAESFFLNGMTHAMGQLAQHGHPSFPVTIYYAFKQAENDGEGGLINTGWDTFLAAVIKAGFAISGTWPMRTELSNRMIGSGTNVLASSVVLVCRVRPPDAPRVTRREFDSSLKRELAPAVAKLLQGAIAPVDLQQAAIGPGMAIFSRYAAVLEASDKPMTVRTALQLINKQLYEVLEGDASEYDSDTRWALTWFQQFGTGEGPYGTAETLATGSGISVDGLKRAGVVASGAGKVRLLRRDELSSTWDPRTDSRLTVWEITQQLVRALLERGEDAAGELLRACGAGGEPARDLAYRLFILCERKGLAAEAGPYNALAVAWPAIAQRAATAPAMASQAPLL
jgi:putative DNA methylase